MTIEISDISLYINKKNSQTAVYFQRVQSYFLQFERKLKPNPLNAVNLLFDKKIY